MKTETRLRLLAAKSPKRPVCQKPDHDIPYLKCGHPLPCPWHTAIIDLGKKPPAVTVPATATYPTEPLKKVARALGESLLPPPKKRARWGLYNKRTRRWLKVGLLGQRNACAKVFATKKAADDYLVSLTRGKRDAMTNLMRISLVLRKLK